MQLSKAKPDAADLCKDQKGHFRDGDSNQDKVDTETHSRRRRERRLALDSSDPAGALAMTRAWLTERCAINGSGHFESYTNAVYNHTVL